MCVWECIRWFRDFSCIVVVVVVVVVGGGGGGCTLNEIELWFVAALLFTHSSVYWISALIFWHYHQDLM